MSQNFNSPDFYNIDELLTEEHKLIRESTRQWVSKSVSPIIEEYAQKAKFPDHLIKELAEIGAFGPYIPEKYGGAGLDQISYGIMMQEIERGDSSIRSTASVQSSLVMYPIWKFGSDEQKEKYEVCRLKKELRKPTEIKCFYTRQDKLGSELIITNDQPTFSCLKEMKCKRE